jgi:hypothetical protein
MPKLYHSAGSWQLPGKQDKKAERVDVPDRAPELAAWLNARRVPLQGDAFDGLVPLNPAADELLGELRSTQLASEPQEGRFWELGPPTKDPPRVAPAFLGDLNSSAEFVPIARSAAIADSYGACPKCQRTWTGQVLAGIASASLDDLQLIAQAIKDHVQELGQQIEERIIQ